MVDLDRLNLFTFLFWWSHQNVLSAQQNYSMDLLLTLCGSIVLVFTIFLISRRKKSPSYPSGPIGLPWLGNILQVGVQIFSHFFKFKAPKNPASVPFFDSGPVNYLPCDNYDLLVSTYVVCERLSVMHQPARFPENFDQILQNTPVTEFGSRTPPPLENSNCSQSPSLALPKKPTPPK